MDNFGKLFAISLTLRALTSVIEGLPIADGVQESQRTYYATAGETIVLSCTASLSDYVFQYWAHSHPNITEIMIDQDDRFSVRNFMQDENQYIYQLTIRDIRQEDNGTYKCVFTNASEVAVARCINVLYRNPVEFLTPDHQIFYFLAGSNVSLECRAKYHEDIQWINPFMSVITISPSERIHTVRKEDGITLVLMELRLQDEGTYYCVASNVITLLTEIQTSIQVYALPSVTVTPSVITAGESENVSFTCNATGYPQPNIVWYKGNLTGLPINTTKVSITDKHVVSVLHFNHLYSEDSAMYYCIVSNPNGSNNASATLNIKYCQALPEQIEAHLIGYLSINVTWHHPVCYHGMEYQNILTISWWMKSSLSVQSHTIQDPVNITHFIITDLDPNTTYFITVSARRDTSNVVNITTGIKDTLESGVTVLTVIVIATTTGIVFILFCAFLVLTVFCMKTFATQDDISCRASQHIVLKSESIVAAGEEVTVQENYGARSGIEIPLAECTAYTGIKAQKTCSRVLCQNFNEVPDLSSSYEVTGFSGLISDVILIPSANICILDLIGQGEFGIVFKANLEQPHTLASTVAVKTLKGFLNHEKVTELLMESVKMKDFDHPNVLNLIGICVDGGPAPYIVMPFMANGSLLNYLKKERQNLVISSIDMIPATRTKLLNILLQIAKGMEYLAGKEILHRDLAARNCMIGSDLVIKVADFGMSESVYSKDYFRYEEQSEAKLPVKWMALESLTDGVFTEKTDVWSFGVTFWEVCTGGKIPYPAVSPWSLPQHLEQGQRLTRPLNVACTDDMYSVMESCWDADPQWRPSFSQLVSTIGTHLNTE